MAQALAFTKDKNQIATPWHIVEFISDLFHVQDKTVLDPTAGHGAMLEHAGKRLGIELDQKPYGMLCDRYPDGEFLNASTFDCADWIKAKQPDVVFMNPPFNVENTKGLEFVRFVASCLDHGYLAAIVPTGAISNGKKAITETKKRLLEHNTLEAVLKLNGELFYPSAAVGVVLMVIKIGEPHNGETWFADLEYDGLEKDRTKGRIDTNGLWQDVKKRWLDIYEEKPSRQIIKDQPEDYIACQMASVTAEDDWMPLTRIPHDPELLRPTLEDFSKTVREYMDWNFNTYGASHFLRRSPGLLPPREYQIEHLRKQIDALQESIRAKEKTLNMLLSDENASMDICEYYDYLCVRFPGDEARKEGWHI